MQTLLFLTIGLGGGALFACLGVSASIMHRASGVVNLAIGTMAMIPALTYHSLRMEATWWCRSRACRRASTWPTNCLRSSPSRSRSPSA